MAKQYKEISPKLQGFITEQKIFFVATAPKDGHINLSPKGMDTLRVMNKSRVLWLNLTGSGNETAAHLLESNRMTLMFCAFEGKPLILRLYGKATIINTTNAQWQDSLCLFPESTGARQIIDMQVDLVQTSCGMGVPYLKFQEERPLLKDWAEKKGTEGLKQYRLEKNQVSINGQPTGTP
ncbi:MAG: pyridoxamine 5'-phosphate oxidase family protein [Thiothrix sp.]|nr:MAG: pyridoxamine 5'-phosphate oxidase family protein [Thiothrix sp.]